MASLTRIILILAGIIIADCASTGGIGESEALDVLEKYGYLAEIKPGAGSLQSPDAVKNALKRFQVYAGLKPSGIVDRETADKFREPRCGMSDRRTLRRGKRYVHQGSEWRKNKLTWRIIRYSSNPRRRLSDMDVRRTMDDTLRAWSAVTNLDFKEVGSDDADIKVSFVRGDHYDRNSFDGRGGTLAHAFYPSTNEGLAGDAHFDDDEIFTLRTKEGTNLYWVALHEFGHSIGMEHSYDQDAIMYPWYQGYQGNDIDLRPDDIKGIQGLYGVRPKKETVAQPKTIAPTLPVTKKPPPPPCFNKIKAAFLGGDKNTYVINNDKLYVLGKYLRIERGPVPIGDVFKGLTKVDAAMKMETGELVFFHGNQYWLFKGYRRISGPNHISRYGLKNEMNNLDAAVSWKGSGKQYFFKGEKFWRYDAANKRIDDGYPKSISSWGSLPSNIDSVLQWRNKAVYFFKGEKYYRFDVRSVSVVPGYPRQLKGDFVMCKVQAKVGGLTSDVAPSLDSKVSGGTGLASTFLTVAVITTFNIVALATNF